MTLVSIPPARQPTLAHMLQARVQQTPQLPAFRESVGKDLPWREINWAEAGQAIMQWRCALQQDGVVHGDRVGIWLP
ncbi:MAG: hypothetical protein KBT18_13050, partial [Comamonas sp.]|nr:hypothetical protein [Candidatus Comamonas equi]